VWKGVEVEAGPQQERDDAEIVALYGSLRRLAFVLCGSREVAEDLVQDTFARCITRIDSLQDPASYLRTALINRWRSQERRRVVAGRWLGAQAPVAPVMPAELVEWRDLLLGLPTRQRGAIALRYLCGLDDPSIAAALGVRPATVRSLIHRGLASLKENYGATDL
jgi:DNA-directed RNA polymerase specialized sigma24 family protein